LKKNKTIDCLGMGIVPFDLLFSVNKYPKAEMKIDAADFKMQGGGPIPNVTVGLSRLDYSTALIAVVGNDVIGDLGISELESEKVICDFVIKKKQSSAVASGWIEKDSGRRTMVLSRKIFIRPDDLMLSDYPIPKIIHLDGRDMPATLKLARWAKKSGAVVSFDIGSIRNDVSSVFPLVDHLVVADSYALPFTKSRTAKQAILKLKKICKGTIIVTEGIKGSLGFENEQFYHQPAYKVNTIDTTGAGDAFHVGYLYGLLKNKRLPSRMKLGAVVAALKCTKPGARTGLPNVKQLNKFLKTDLKSYMS